MQKYYFFYEIPVCCFFVFKKFIIRVLLCLYLSLVMLKYSLSSYIYCIFLSETNSLSIFYCIFAAIFNSYKV